MREELQPSRVRDYPTSLFKPEDFLMHNPAWLKQFTDVAMAFRSLCLMSTTS